MVPVDTLQVPAYVHRLVCFYSVFFKPKGVPGTSSGKFLKYQVSLTKLGTVPLKKLAALTVYPVYYFRLQKPRVYSTWYLLLTYRSGTQIRKIWQAEKTFWTFTCVSFTLPANLCLFCTYSVLQILDTGKYFHFIFFFQIDIWPCYFDERCKGNQYPYGPNKNVFFSLCAKCPSNKMILLVLLQEANNPRK